MDDKDIVTEEDLEKLVANNKRLGEALLTLGAQLNPVTILMVRIESLIGLLSEDQRLAVEVKYNRSMEEILKEALGSARQASFAQGATASEKDIKDMAARSKLFIPGT